jgi:hypothetical protein
LQNRIAELAKAHGGNRTRAIQAAILKASDTPQSNDVPDEAEVLRLLGEAARSGNVSAMKELRVYHREQAEPDEGTDFISQLEDFANQA